MACIGEFVKLTSLFIWSEVYFTLKVGKLIFRIKPYLLPFLIHFFTDAISLSGTSPWWNLAISIFCPFPWEFEIARLDCLYWKWDSWLLNENSSLTFKVVAEFIVDKTATDDCSCCGKIQGLVVINIALAMYQPNRYNCPCPQWFNKFLSQQVFCVELCWAKNLLRILGQGWWDNRMRLIEYFQSIAICWVFLCDVYNQLVN